MTGRLREVLPVDAEVLDQDWRTRALVERLFEQLVELAVAVNSHVTAAESGIAPEEYRTSFSAMADIGAIRRELADRLGQAAGMPNIIVHDYLGTDMRILADGVTRAPDDFDAYVTAVAAWLAAHADG